MTLDVGQTSCRDLLNFTDYPDSALDWHKPSETRSDGRIYAFRVAFHNIQSV
jgi:hypothetical protein